MMGLLDNFDLGGAAKGLFDFIAMTNPEIRRERAAEEERKRQAERQRMADQMAQQQFEMQRAQFEQQRGLLAQQQADDGLLKRGLLLPEMEGARPADGMGPGAPVANKGIDPQWFLSQGGSVGGLGKALEMNRALFPSGPKPADALAKINPADYTPESFREFMQSGDAGKLVPYRKPENNLNDLLIPGPNGPVLNQALLDAKRQIAAAGAPQTRVQVDAGPKAFWTDFGKAQVDQLTKEGESAKAAADTVRSVAEIRKAAAAGAYQGAGAELKLGAAKALGAIGMPYDERTVANTEAFNAQAKGFVLNTIKSLGANPSNADREFIEQTIPRLQTDPAALPRLLEFMENKARSQIRSYNNKARKVQSQPGAQFLPYSLEVPEPPASDGFSIRKLP